MQDDAGRNDPRPRCLIVGQHRLLVECLHLLLQSELDICSTMANSEAAVDLVRHFDPQLVIVHWPSSSDQIVNLIRRLREERPGLAITVLSDEHPGGNLQTSAERFSSATDLLRRLRTRGAPVSTQLIGARPQESHQPKAGAKLSHRELQVLVLLVRGLRMKEVARRLGISPRTVAFHKYRAMESNGLRTQADLLNFALHHGFLSGEPPERLKTILTPLSRHAKDTHPGDTEAATSIGHDQKLQ